MFVLLTCQDYEFYMEMSIRKVENVQLLEKHSISKHVKQTFYRILCVIEKCPFLEVETFNSSVSKPSAVEDILTRHCYSALRVGHVTMRNFVIYTC